MDPPRASRKGNASGAAPAPNAVNGRCPREDVTEEIHQGTFNGKVLPTLTKRGFRVERNREKVTRKNGTIERQSVTGGRRSTSKQRVAAGSQKRQGPRTTQNWVQGGRETLRSHNKRGTGASTRRDHLACPKKGGGGGGGGGVWGGGGGWWLVDGNWEGCADLEKKESAVDPIAGRLFLSSAEEEELGRKKKKFHLLLIEPLQLRPGSGFTQVSAR